MGGFFVPKYHDIKAATRYWLVPLQLLGLYSSPFASADPSQRERHSEYGMGECEMSALSPCS
jgi:hypothetical protein